MFARVSPSPLPVVRPLRNAMISSFLLNAGSANLYIRTGPSGTLCTTGAQPIDTWFALRPERDVLQ
jgi:hypothetical protein